MASTLACMDSSLISWGFSFGNHCSLPPLETKGNSFQKLGVSIVWTSLHKQSTHSVTSFAIYLILWFAGNLKHCWIFDCISQINHLWSWMLAWGFGVETWGLDIFYSLRFFYLCRGNSKGDVAVVNVKSMAVYRRFGSAHVAPVTALEFSKQRR